MERSREVKDTSKAKWPEGMKISVDGQVFYITENHLALVKVNGLDVTAMESRARQICALPQMVALLKGLAETYMSYKSVDIDFQLDDYYKEAYDICKSIGEVE